MEALMMPVDPTDTRYDEFTESHYARFLALAQSRYQFESYGTSCAKPHVLWRHDVDVSMHRAAKLAAIEAEAGVTATYFLLLHSEYYNLFEKSVVQLVKSIVGAGHQLGLHFDGELYELQGREALDAKLRFEKKILEDLFEQPINAVSYHNPDVSNILQYDDDVIAGMHNAYGKTLRESYTYCSDSNGYWRFQTLEEVLLSEKPRLQILTHPEWWVSTAMAPRERIVRCIEGRAAALAQLYDRVLYDNNRLNLGKSS